MRGTKAKAIRKAVYGESSLRIKREYIGGKIGVISKGYSTAPIQNHPDSPRAKYQKAKKAS